MNIYLNLKATSYVHISMSARWRFDGTAYSRALADSTVAYPGEVMVRSYPFAIEEYYSCDFYLSNLTEGSHTIEIQCRVKTVEFTANVFERILCTIAFPIS